MEFTFQIAYSQAKACAYQVYTNSRIFWVYYILKICVYPVK